ncbi:hypothetical protein ABDJ41_10240 [Pedobacter sp. ASV1-7]
MKIALFSDIHANLPAFEAMLQDMDNQNERSLCRFVVYWTFAQTLS